MIDEVKTDLGWVSSTNLQWLTGNKFLVLRDGVYKLFRDTWSDLCRKLEDAEYSLANAHIEYDLNKKIDLLRLGQLDSVILTHQVKPRSSARKTKSYKDQHTTLFFD